MKKKARNIIVVVIITIMLAYLAMMIDTNSLMGEVRDAFLWKISPDETANRPIDVYNYSRRADTETLGDVNLILVRLLVIHNFRDGYMWAYYSYEARNPEGEIITGSWHIITKWKIHKENGKWEIIQIIEAP